MYNLMIFLLIIPDIPYACIPVGTKDIEFQFPGSCVMWNLPALQGFSM